MAEQRNRVELDRREIQRRYEYVRDQRRPASLRSDVSRQDALQRLARVKQSSEPGMIEQTFKLGLVVAGAAAFHKFMFKSRAGLEMLDSVGRHGRNFSYQAKKFITHAASYVSKDPATSLRIARIQRGITKPREIFEQGRIADLEDAIHILRSSGDRDTQQAIISGEAGHHMRRILKGRATSRGRDGGWLAGLARLADTRSSDLVHGLDDMRFGDLIQKNSRLVSERSQGIIRQGMELGLVGKNTRVGKGAMIDRATGKVLDASWATGRNLWGGFQTAMDQIRIPIVGFRLGSFFRGPAHFVSRSMYGQRGMRFIRGGTTIPGVAKLNRGGFAIGDVLYGLDDIGVKKIGEGFRWFDPTKEKGIARVAGAQLGLFTRPRQFDVVDSWGNRLQEKLGMGPQYATERSVFSRLVLDPYRRLTRGVAGVKPKRTSDSQEFLSKVLDQVEGVERQTDLPPKYGRLDDMPAKKRWWEKVKASFGGSEHIQYTQPGRQPGFVGGIRRPDAGMGFQGEEFAAYHSKESPWLGLNYLASRPSEMFSWMTGMGFRPGAGRAGFLKSAAKTAGLGYGIYGGVEAVRYADYAVEDTTGFSPMEFGADIYTRIRLGQKWAQDKTGITATARYLEDVAPKSMSSPASGLFRAALPVFIGAAKGAKGFYAGLAGAVALSGLPHSVFQPEDILKSYEEMQQEYQGLKRVPIRKNRWWELNSEEFTGGKIKFFRKSWYAQMKSGYEYTDVKYGSKGNYWKYQSPLPTPSNWFGLRKIMNPDFVAEAQAIRRPYPSTFGGVGGSGGGSMVPDVTGGGLGNIPTATSAKQRFSGAWERTTEHLGAYKFLGETVLGVESPFEARIEMASASEMTSVHRKYWDQDLGGLMGATELMRRFMLPRNAMAKGYNPLPNVAPGWLPGIRSQFSEDSRYFLDFHRGDPYTKVQNGEFRMPGPGYEAIQRMHSGIPGVYDAYDRYRILADVAPYSKAYRHYATIVRSWSKAGFLDKSWQMDYETTQQEYQATREGGQFVERKFTSHQEGLAAINNDIKYSGFEQMAGGMWETVTHDIIPSIPFGRKMLKAETSYESYLENEVYGETYKDWRTPMKGFIAPHFNRAASKGPFMGAALGSGIAVMGGSPITKIALAITGAAIGGVGGAIHGKGWVPAGRKAEMGAMEYFDKLQYIRAKRLQGVAMQDGDMDAARLYKRESERTIVGLPRDASLGQMQAAMPKSLKPYFKGMIAAGPQDRMNVLKTVPEYTRPIFQRLWGMQTPEESGTPDEQVLNYFRQNEMPGQDWMGWMPSTPFAMSKLKIMEDQGINAHHMHEWTDESLANPVVYANMETPPGFIGSETDPTELETLRRNLASVHLLSGSMTEAPSSYWKLKRRDMNSFNSALARFR